MTSISAIQYLKIYRDMVSIRCFEFALEREFKKGLVPGMLHTGVGQEATLVAINENLRKEDGLFPDHRCHGLLYLKGSPGQMIMAELFGKANGICSGKGGSLHLADAGVNNFGNNGIQGSVLVTALGIALGWKMQKMDRVVAVIFGDGTTGEGEFHESLNLAKVWQLPVLYCCVNNGYAISTPVASSHATANLFEHAETYGIPAKQIDGNNLSQSFIATQQAVRHIRSGKGPYFIEYKTWRWQGLFMGEFRSEEDVRYWKQEYDPIQLARQEILNEGIAVQAEIDRIHEETASLVDSWVTFAFQGQAPDPAKASTDVYVGWEGYR